jgi:hypothetical protein
MHLITRSRDRAYHHYAHSPGTVFTITVIVSAAMGVFLAIALAG